MPSPPEPVNALLPVVASRVSVPGVNYDTPPGHESGPGPTDPIIAELAQAVAAALVARLRPWLDQISAGLARLIPVMAPAPAAAGPNIGGAPPAILLSADDARAYCGGLAKSTWSDFDQRGVIPAAVRVGGRVFWRRADLDLWAAKDCPGRGRFAAVLETERAPARSQARSRPGTAN